MDSRKSKHVIALSIRPKYAHAILSKAKTVEFRRNGVPTSINNILIYSTKPDQLVIGYCDVLECVVEPPEILWKKYGHRGLINRDDYNEYYKGYELGKCYIIDNPRRFTVPIPLNRCKSFLTPPQSFAYVDKNEWRNIRRKKICVSNS